MNDSVKTKEFTVLTPFTVKEADVQDRTGENVLKVVGYCNWAGKDMLGRTYTDLAGDVVVPSGVDLSVWSENPQILWQHNREQSIGKGLLMEKREDGLYIEAEIHKDAMDHKDFYRVKSGLVSMFSIGFRTYDCEYRDVDGMDAFFITKSLLLEVSIVSIPANSKSSFSVLKSLDGLGFTSDACKRSSTAVDQKEQDEVLPMKIKQEDGTEVELIDLIKNTVVSVLDARDAAKTLADEVEAARVEAERLEAARIEKEKEDAELAASELAEAARIEAEKAATEEKAVAAAGESLKSLAAELDTIKGLLA